MRILILGGTSEANALVDALPVRPDLDVTVSLAGRTAAPRLPARDTRIGGFGGVDGLSEYLRQRRVDLLVDAAHPFAANISANAAAASARTGVPILAIRRPPWPRLSGDDWTEVDSIADSVAALGTAPRRVFLTVGRTDIAVFARAPQHDYVARTIEPVGGALPVPRITTLLARGPFDEESEVEVLRSQRIAVVVTKNAGGPATYGKVAAARRLGIPVVIVRQPHKPAVPQVADAKAALARILALADGPREQGHAASGAGTLRRV
ncbi:MULTISPECIES: cobalt-precorrin-6A reductase [Methylobacterium]|uniref:Precorrin-6A reductase n=3 Tax=Pseudomonadota TaxID=1224 RepID=A0ABQ4SVD7_9HYPH|nr:MULTISPECIES: cobalt-precorrin-6A reductase [Methylobacterium]PIU07074.1 MAG: cobalt-precorrin-6A reductase [Methylobacterium sp. CG09_land_8_20_14_0_10_71_15]PIU12279.1 MAG: cobalt-precorrin-6A reductase [Methylobacterium sp. CG08_land_8_20_14_0_20_71_15]GJE07062.1 Precorrin-6A reductase [Methylobacterium jeotgali]